MVTELEQAAIDAVREASETMNEALRIAHETGLEVEIDILRAQKVSEQHPRLIISGHCKKISYEINQPF